MDELTEETDVRPDAKEVAPGPSAWTVLKQAYRKRSPKSHVGTLLALSRQYGDERGVFRIRLPNHIFHVIDHPEHSRYVLQKNNRNYRKSRDYQAVKLMVGEGLLTSEGDFWRRQRRLAQPAFHKKSVEALSSTVSGETERFLHGWDNSARRREHVDVLEEMTELTLRIVIRALFSSDAGDNLREIGRAQRVLNSYVGRRIAACRRMGALYSWTHHLPTPQNRRYRRELRTLDEAVYNIIRQRQAAVETGAGAKEDLLGMLLSVQDEETGERMDEKQLRDEVITFLIGGHETTSSSLSWALYLLSQNPEAAERVEEETDRVLNGRTPSFADLPLAGGGLVFTEMVFKETLRLYPPAWTITRAPVEDDVVAGYHIPQGSTVAILPYLIHRNPHYWDRPEDFDPERFAPEREEERHPWAYLPFGAGPRQCIGKPFAMMEGVLVLAAVARRFRLQTLASHPVGIQPAVTLRPTGLHMMPKQRG